MNKLLKSVASVPVAGHSRKLRPLYTMSKTLLITGQHMATVAAKGLFILMWFEKNKKLNRETPKPCRVGEKPQKKAMFIMNNSRCCKHYKL